MILIKKFEELYNEIREHRKEIKNCVSAKDEVNIPKLLENFVTMIFIKQIIKQLLVIFG